MMRYDGTDRPTRLRTVWDFAFFAVQWVAFVGFCVAVALGIAAML